MFKVAWHERYCHPLPPGHRFPMEKYNLVPQQLLYEGTLEEENFFTPSPLAPNQILTTHDLHYWEKLRNQELSRQEERRTGFPLSESLVKREITIMGGTYEAAKYAMEHGVAGNIAGGTHHAFTDCGEGFCLLNDIALTANLLLEEGSIENALVVDLDVHQGNGTAQIFREESRVFTFSMHGDKNFPLRKEPSNLDIPLPDNTADDSYLHTLAFTLPELLDEQKPDLVLYQCGVDTLQSDKLGRLSMTVEGCRKRDEIVFTECEKRGIPVVFSMGGGYSPSIREIIEAHSNTYRLAQDMYF